ncbi:FMN-binding protein [Extibacter muris]|uniref:FMN-binding protein n=1 Tax=Extibacter muris TaxID=1796622 RepID=UPI001D08D64F|nr:FMN-binding protein [Extibacter muris]MCB6203113.1 FMN-binding protein [Extibacter muris]MCQ4664338.1 FMN-binding protein [Extibacter muris]MCQ4692324.1 FMN-binding protein [Extibacter muris]MCQ4692431.1 FMN-binding protein [Extibacter muris]
MGIITGYLCLLCLCILLVKALTRKFHFVKMDRIIMRIHKTVSAAFLIICILHIILVYPVLKMRHMLVPVTGILIAGVSAAMIALCHMVKNKKRNLTIHRILSLVMLCCVVGHIVIYFVDYKNYQTRIHEIQIEDVTISDIKDGRYTGFYDAGYIYAKVEVTVKDGQITNINILKHNNERGALAETITDEVIAKQQVDVDTISSATNSSMVIKKAIENALK